jgi:2-succinyl-6-hydroxy-2,4-cyclohexadiene-1-carboxylate synthase
VPELWLLHGFLGAPESWRAVVRALRHAGAVRAPVLFGHGSPPEPVPASFDAAVDALAAGIAGGIVVGYSFGGRLALGLARRHGRKLRGAVAIGAHPGLADDDQRAARREWESAEGAKLETHGLETFVRSWEALPLFASQRELPASTRDEQRRTRLSHDALGVARAMTGLGTGSMPPVEPAALGCPVLLVSGALDTEHRERAAALSRRAPPLEHAVLPGVGHNPLLEAPEALAALIDDRARRWSETHTLEEHP